MTRFIGGSSGIGLAAMRVVPLNYYLALGFTILGVTGMWFAFDRYKVLSKDFPPSENPKFALLFGVGWILFFTGIASLWLQ
jgi:hypothetical protein